MKAARYLHFSPCVPAPWGNGLAMRTSMFTEALARLGRTRVVSIGHGASPGRPWQPGGVEQTHIDPVGSEDSRLRLIARLPDARQRAGALLEYGRPLVTAALSAPVLREARAAAGTGTPAAVVLSRARMLPLLGLVMPGWNEAEILVDLDDDEGGYCRDLAARAGAGGNQALAALYEAEAQVYDSMIMACAERVSLFFAASEAVRDSLARRLGLRRIAVIPNGVEPPPRVPERDGKGLVFVGNLGNEPNIDGVVWFIDEIWPRIHLEAPDARLVVAGATPAPAVRAACNRPGIELQADPEDLFPLYASASVAIVPLRMGSGTRIKIIEAALFGRPVIATAKGAEGLYPEIVAELSVADSADAFARACIRNLEAPPSQERLRALALAHYDRTGIIGRIAEVLRCPIGRGPEASPEPDDPGRQA